MAIGMVIFFGDKKTGKTDLIGRMLDKEKYGLPRLSKETTGIVHRTAVIDKKNEIMFWVTSGQERFKSIREAYYPNMQVAVFCIDLSKKIDIETIQANIKKFQQLNKKSAPVILVGTKKNEAIEGNIEVFECIKITGGIHIHTKRFITSAKNDKNEDELLECIRGLCFKNELANENKTQKNSDSKRDWNEAKKQLLNDTKKSGFSVIIEDAVTQLENDLQNAREAKAKTDAINKFVTTCKNGLQGKNNYFLDVVLAFAAFAVVTVIAATIGFGIGFALGAWTGPGAFITGLMGGCAAAVAVASAAPALGLVASGLTAYGLFKEPKEMSAVRAFAKEAKELEVVAMQ